MTAPPAPASTTPPPTPPRPTKLRIPRPLVALGVAITAAGAVLAAFLVTNVGHTEPVVAVSKTVYRGQVITADDLTSAQVNKDPHLKTIPYSQRDTVIGKRAGVDLAAGSVVTPDAAVTDTVPAKGQSIVGIPLKIGQLPTQQLRPGDLVRLVATPRDADTPSSSQPTLNIQAVVVTVSTDEQGTSAGGVDVVVDVTVTVDQAPVVAAAAATGRIALILDAPGSR